MLMRSYLLFAVFALSPSAYAEDDLPWQKERKVHEALTQLEPVEALRGTEAYAPAQAVGRLERVEPDSDLGVGYCTAAHVGPHLFLTSQHCLISCRQMQILLGYERDRPAGAQQTYRCSSILLSNSHLDYALIAAEPVTTYGRELPFPILALYQGEVWEGQPVYSVGHAAGGFKDVDRSPTCALGSVEVQRTESGRDSIAHSCETQAGSTGAPLIDRDHGYAVALHWAGSAHGDSMAIPMAAIVSDLQLNLTPQLQSQLQIVQ